MGNKYTVKNDGVTFYCEADAFKINVYDINIPDGVTRIKFKGFKNNTGINLRSVYIDIKNNKVFPDVEELWLQKDVNVRSIPNAMFPNVRNVVYPDGVHPQTFKNVFYSDENTVIDLSGYSLISANAFVGCKTTKLINTEGIVSCDEHAFDNSAFADAPFVKGVKMAGTIMYDVDEECEDVEIPEYVRCCRDCLYVKKIKRIRVTDINHISPKTGSQYFRFNNIFVDCDMDDEYEFLNKLNRLAENCERLDIRGNHLFKSNDGMLYSADMKELLLCPSKRCGHVVIPEGVESIAPRAFFCSSIESVTMPETLKIIHPYAFYKCTILYEAELNEGLESLCPSAFEGCISLEEIEIPGSVKVVGHECFKDCTLSSVILHDGIRELQHHSIDSVQRVVNIPASMDVIDEGCFTEVDIFNLEGKLPHNMLDSVMCTRYIPEGRPLVTFRSKDCVLYFPRVCSTSITQRHMCSIEKLPLDVIQKNVYRFICNIHSGKDRNAALLALYEATKSENIKELLKADVERYALYLIDNDYEKDFIRLLKTDTIKVEALRSIFDKIKERDDITTAKAYVLEKINNCRVIDGFGL